MDSEYENFHVRENLEIFIADVKEAIEEYGKRIYQNTAILKLRKEILKVNDILSQESLLNEKDLKILEEKNFIFKRERENAIHDYFWKLDTFENYCENFPDQITQLEEIFEQNEKINPQNIVRSNYIEKHIKDAFADFQAIILKKPYEISVLYLEKYFASLKDNVRSKIEKRLAEEGLIDNKNNNNKTAFPLNIKSLNIVFSFLLSLNVTQILGIWMRGGMNALLDILP